MALTAMAWVLAGHAALQLKGSVSGPHDGWVYLQKYIDRYYELIDSAAIAADGTFNFTNDVELPEIYGLSTSHSADDTPLLVILDEGNVSVALNTEQKGYRGSRIEGSRQHQLYEEFHRQREANIVDFIRQHPADLAALYILYREQAPRLSSTDVLAYLELFETSLQQKSYAEILRKLVDVREVVSVGQQAPDFTIPDADGQPVSLSQLLGKGYLLIDFWASWCGPCRRENPHVVKTYEEFHDKGFDILGVSLDRSREPWLKAIEQDGLRWHHVSELKFWNSDAVRKYGIRTIPANVLVDNTGKIVARNLRGGDLSDTLRQLLGER